MKGKKIKPLPLVEAFALYWLRRARRVLKMKQSEYDCFHIDYMHTDWGRRRKEYDDAKHIRLFRSQNNVEVWFFAETNVIAWAIFNHNGRKISIGDKRGKK